MPLPRLPVLVALVLAGTAAPVGRAGPPYITDDPEPCDYRHWEVYLASMTSHGPDGMTGTLPHVEVNYGVVPNGMIHLIVADGFAAGPDQTRTYGLADTELGFKYRFVTETPERPEIGVFPLLELPTGSRARGLGNGRTQLFLPVWAQKNLGRWSVYGGGGYWINPAPGARDSVFTGLVIQNQVAKTLALGGEIYRQTATAVGAGPRSQFNLGFVWDWSDLTHLIASIGPSVEGPGGYQSYLAWQWTFGPQ